MSIFKNKEKMTIKASKKIKKFYRKLGIKLNIKTKKDECICDGFFNFNGQECYLNVRYDADVDTLQLKVFYGEIDIIANSLDLLNRFNCESLHWRAFIEQEKHFLIFEAEECCVHIRDLKNILTIYMGLLADDDNDKYFLEFRKLIKKQ